jgi:hypothetical protein
VTELIVRELRLRPFTGAPAVVERAAVEPTTETGREAVGAPDPSRRLVARHSRRSSLEERVL